MSKKSLSGSIAVLLLLLSACAQGFSPQPLGQENSPQNTPLDQPAPASATPSAQPPPTPEPAEPLPDGPLTAAGPWLFYAQTDGRGQVSGLGTANLNGTGLTPILDAIFASYTDDTFQPKVVDFSLSPNGRYLAVQVQLAPADVILWVLQLPSGELVRTIPLFGPEARQALENSPPGLNYITAQAFPVSFLWSPDSRALMISGAIDGPSTDVYTFEPDTGVLNRLTTGPGEAVLMGWSPDSNWLVFQSLAPATQPHKIDAIYALSVDGARLNKLYTPVGTNIDVIVGWINDTSFIAYSAPFSAPATELRQVEVTTGRADSLLSALFSSAAKAPGSPVILVDLYGFPNYNPEVAPGTHRFSPGSNDIAKFSTNSYAIITWIPELELFAATPRLPVGQVSFFNTAGETQFTVPRSHPIIRWPVVSPDGRFLLTPNGEDYQLYAWGGELIAKVPGLGQVLWLPDSTAFIQYTGSAIHLYPAASSWTGEVLNPLFQTHAEFQIINP